MTATEERVPGQTATTVFCLMLKNNVRKQKEKLKNKYFKRNGIQWYCYFMIQI